MDMMVSDMEVKGNIFTIMAEPWEQWFGTSNPRLRGVGESLPWALSQLRGGFAATCAATFDILVSAPNLEFCEVILPTLDQLKSLAPEQVQGRQGELSLLMAHSALAINFSRLRRCAWFLLGWSSRSALFTEDSPAAQPEVGRSSRTTRTS